MTRFEEPEIMVVKFETPDVLTNSGYIINSTDVNGTYDPYDETDIEQEYLI